MKKLMSLGAMILLLGSSFAQQKIDYVEYDLPNGMHVILHEDHSTPIVAVSILYHVGSKNEKVGRTGFAHFFEHLLFEGSTNIDRGEYSELVEKNGGTLNANTSNDRTYYYELLPSNQLELGLWLESERLLHAKVDETGIETQRSVVKEEKRQRVDNQPYATFLTETFKRMFVNHPYNWVPIGSMEDLDAAQEEDYVNFYRTYYVPSNATLSIAGDLDIEQTKKWIAKYFGSIPAGQAINMYRDWENMSEAAFQSKYGVKKSAFTAENWNNPKDAKAKAAVKKYSAMPIEIKRPEVYSGENKAMADTVYDNIQLPALFITYPFPTQTDKDFFALEMMNEVFSSGSSSRLNKTIVEKKELAVQCFSFPFGMEAGGIGIFGAIAADGADLTELQNAFDAEIDRIQNELITEEEFQKIRNSIENDIIGSRSMASVAEELANSYVYYGDAGRINTLLDKYMAVTREDIQRVAKMYLNNDARLILYYLLKEEN